MTTTSPKIKIVSGLRTATTSKDDEWRSFPKVPNLLQYVNSGAYFARVKVKGKVILQSLLPVAAVF